MDSKYITCILSVFEKNRFFYNFLFFYFADVPAWLKGLRLHKYAYLFQQLTYDQMLDMGDDWLEAQNVTKGARNKIILSIKKLRERQATLRALEKVIIYSSVLVYSSCAVIFTVRQCLHPSVTQTAIS